MKAAEQAKAEGLKSLSQVSEMTGVSLQTLGNWAKNKPALFSVVLAGCKATQGAIEMKRTTAAIVSELGVVALVKTNGKNGENVRYGFNLTNNALDANREKDLVSVGEGKISRAKKYLADDERMECVDSGYCEDGSATLEAND
ncbi:hypothetical protein DJ031_06815 [bacterium endosymbiont of Escarpia laminata]|nr:MAG: hypothetical protein DJ031_06815 [bacterium endosymbiont of Escarpia laminata]